MSELLNIDDERMAVVARRAADLECYVEKADPEDCVDDGDEDQFWLRCAEGYDICPPLPLTMIIEALECLRREHAGDEEAWRNFGGLRPASVIPMTHPRP